MVIKTKHLHEGNVGATPLSLNTKTPLLWRSGVFYKLIRNFLQGKCQVAVFKITGSKKYIPENYCAVNVATKALVPEVFSKTIVVAVKVLRS